MNKITALLTALLLTVSAARADFYSDNNPADVWINALNPSYTGEFTLAGYDPVAQTITSAYAEFTFWDLVAGESIKIDLSGDLLTHGSFSGWLPLSVGIVNAWVTLDTTGALSYTVSRNDNSVLSEFWLK
ncbi:MAG TPA: hypothetical protein VHN79_11365, partial [Lacunisphaera sp.]|nr:hypothetical protein [Lacunisphaera sp.]